MDILETLIGRNRDYADRGFVHDLKMLPTARTLIVGCVDPRVDPADVLGLKPGEAVVIRNVGGRINRALIETMTILGVVARGAGKEIGVGWNLIVLHHTDCGIIGCYKHAPELLAKHLNVSASRLDSMAIDDPREAVRLDVAALRADESLPAGFMVSGVVYDVADGKAVVVVPPAPLREGSAASADATSPR